MNTKYNEVNTEYLTANAKSNINHIKVKTKHGAIYVTLYSEHQTVKGKTKHRSEYLLQ